MLTAFQQRMTQTQRWMRYLSPDQSLDSTPSVDAASTSSGNSPDDFEWISEADIQSSHLDDDSDFSSIHPELIYTPPGENMSLDGSRVYSSTDLSSSLPDLVERPERQWSPPERDYSTPPRSPSPRPHAKDLRSASIPYKRDRIRNEKYYHFRHIKPGQLSKPHYIPVRGSLRHRRRYMHTFGISVSKEEEEEVVDPDVYVFQEFTMKKTTMYRAAQLWPHPPKYHRRRSEKDYYPWSFKVVRRRENRMDAKMVIGEELMEWKEGKEACV